MDRDAIIRTIIKRAEVGWVEPQQALETLADQIARLDKLSDTYESDVARLIDIGACVWQLGSRG